MVLLVTLVVGGARVGAPEALTAGWQEGERLVSLVRKMVGRFVSLPPAFQPLVLPDGKIVFLPFIGKVGGVHLGVLLVGGGGRGKRGGF